MKKEFNKKILVAVDGSERSMNTVHQIAGLEAFRDMELVLFNVFAGVPEAYWDLAKEPQSIKNYAYLHAWESQRKKEVQEFMDRSVDILTAAGLPRKNIKIKIHQRKKGFARDILEEAKKGYGALVLRRRGMTQVAEIIMGSVSVKVLEKGGFIPLLFIGQKPVNNKFMLAMDGSEGAVKALDFIGRLFKGQECRIQLTHVIRGENMLGSASDEIMIPGEIFEDARAEIQGMLSEERDRLLKIGFREDQVETKIITGEASRAWAIANEAEAGDFGTIVMGRRGLSRVQEFFMGRVSNKVLHIALRHSVWIVS